jgi:hypothetical protein
MLVGWQPNLNHDPTPHPITITSSTFFSLFCVFFSFPLLFSGLSYPLSSKLALHSNSNLLLCRHLAFVVPIVHYRLQLAEEHSK